MLTIEQHYEENVKVGDFLFAKVGLTIRSDKPLSNPDELESHSAKILALAKGIVKTQLEEIKEERKG